MAVIDLVKWNGTKDLLAWKFPSQELSTWTQLIVNESQEAYLVHAGVYEGPFGAGRHTLDTENIPVIRNLMGIPFGGKSPFAAEVWFVNKNANIAIPWGTPDPIQLEDPKYKLMIPVRAFGQYWVRVKDSKKFLLTLVGTLNGFDSKTLDEYFAGVLSSRIKDAIATSIIRDGISILEIATELDDISEVLHEKLKPEFEEYGVELAEFHIRSINVPEEDPAVIQLKASLAKRAELGILGLTYQQDRSFDVLETAAGNEGSAGSVLGAGLGLGLGAGIGTPMGQMASAASSVLNVNQPNADDSAVQQADKFSLLERAFELKAKKIITPEEFEIEKKKILEG